MKRMIAAVLATAFALCGCGAKALRPEQAAQLLAPPFLLTGEYTLGEVSGTLSLSRPDAENMSVTFHTPDTAAGLTLTLSGSTAHITFGEMQYCDLPLAELPEGNPLRLFTALFYALAAKTPDCEPGEQGKTIYRFDDGVSITAYGSTVRTIEIPTGHFSLQVTGLDHNVSS